MEKTYFINSYLVRFIVDGYGEIASMWFNSFDDHNIKQIISSSQINDFDKIINQQKFLTATVYPDNEIFKRVMEKCEKEFNKQKALSVSESEFFNLNQCPFYDVWNDSKIDIIFIDFPNHDKGSNK